MCTDPDVLWWQWVDTWRVVTQHNVSAWNQSKMGRRRCRKKVSCLMYWKLCMTWLALNTRYYKRQFASFAFYLSPTLVQDAAVSRARLRPGLVPAAAGGRGGQPAAAVRREAGLLSRLQRRQPGQQPGQVEQGRVATMNVDNECRIVDNVDMSLLIILYHTFCCVWQVRPHQGHGRNRGGLGGPRGWHLRTFSLGSHRKMICLYLQCERCINVVSTFLLQLFKQYYNKDHRRPGLLTTRHCSSCCYYSDSVQRINKIE